MLAGHPRPNRPLCLGLQERLGRARFVPYGLGGRDPPRPALEHQDASLVALLKRARDRERGHRAAEPAPDHHDVDLRGDVWFRADARVSLGLLGLPLAAPRPTELRW